MYICSKCGKEFKTEDIELTINSACSYCGSKVFFKKTPPVVVKTKAE
ncbi:DNA-directed RNA polymerase subunit P [Candidatus Micrarchaeota archaeon]|nr:DNA-directed RNA polymerase subunit P [Candidatus Micrarchaeota archaeon]